MVSDSDLITRLHEFLSASDLNTTTTAIVRRRLEEDFGLDLSDRKAFIREQVDLYVQSQVENAVENEENSKEDSDGGDGDAAEEEEEVEEEEEEEEEESTTGKTASKKGSIFVYTYKFLSVCALFRCTFGLHARKLGTNFFRSF